MDEKEAEKLIKAAANVLLKPILSLLQEDPHIWSTRPCATCRTISGIVGEPFGCSLYAIQRRKKG